MLSCQVEIPESSLQTFADTAADKALTVGGEFAILCNGAWPENFYPENSPLPEFVLAKEQAHSVKLLGLEFTGKDQAKLTVTSYKAGLLQFRDLTLKSGEQVQSLGDLEWTVASVMNPNEPQQEPYGPQGPFKLTIPLAYWVILFAVIFLFVFTIGTKLYRRSQRKKLMSDSRLQESALAPAQQFYQSLRKLQREFGFFNGVKAEEGEITKACSAVEEAYKTYISRVFNVPALNWSPSLVISDIKKQKYQIDSELLTKMKKNLNELERASKSKVKVSEKDCQQLIELVRVHVDSLETSKQREE